MFFTPHVEYQAIPPKNLNSMAGKTPGIAAALGMRLTTSQVLKRMITFGFTKARITVTIQNPAHEV